MYELFRNKLPQLTPGCDIVCIISSPEVRTLEQEQLDEILSQLLQEAGLYKNQ